MYKTAMRLSARPAHLARRESVGVVDRAGPDPLEPVLVRLDVFRALGALPLRQRQAVVLRDWAGFGTERVAAMLGTRESTVRVHLARGRRTLRHELNLEEG